jgi:hypothetical protein
MVLGWAILGHSMALKGSPFFSSFLSSGFSVNATCIHKSVAACPNPTPDMATGGRGLVVPLLVTLFINKKMFLSVHCLSPELFLQQKWPEVGTGTS